MAVQTTTKSEQSTLPAWATDYYSNILGRGLSMIDEPYIPYEGARIAGFTPEQEQAFGLVQSGIGSYQPYIDEATGMVRTSAGKSGAAAAAPYLTTAGTERAMTAVAPYMGAATSRESMAAAEPYLRRAGIGSALSAASPYLASGATSFLDRAQDYMNPYNEAVTRRIGELAGRNLTENILPGVNRTFIGGGTFGGSRSAEFTRRAIRDAQEAALAEQDKALQAGYAQAADIYGQDAKRQLDAAVAAGQLSEADLSRALATGKSYADIASEIAGRNLQAGQLASTTSAADLARMVEVGKATGQLTADDADRILRGAATMAGLGEQTQRQRYADVSALSDVGAAKQGLAQRSMDLAYGDFAEQRDYPMTQLKKLQALGSGIDMPTSTSTTATAPGPSALSQIAGLGASAIGTIGATGGFGKGGWLSSLGSGFGGSGGGVAKKTGGRVRKQGLGWLKEMS